MDQQSKEEREYQAVLPLRGKILNTYVDTNGSKKNGNANEHRGNPFQNDIIK